MTHVTLRGLLTGPPRRGLVRRTDGGAAPTRDPAGDPVSLEGYADAVAALGEHATARALGQARRDLAHVLEDVDESRLDVLGGVLAEAIDSSALDTMAYLLGVRTRATFTPAQHEAVTEIVRLGVAFQRNITGLRLTQHGWQAMIFDLIEEGAPPAARPPLMREAVERLTGYYEQVVDLMISDYLNEQQRSVARRVSEQRELIGSLVAGERPEPATVNQTLGLDIDHHHLGLVVWDQESAARRGDNAAHGRAAQAVAAGLGAPPPLLLGGAEPGTLWAWVTRPRPIQEDALVAGRILAADSPVRIAVGVPGVGLDGFRMTHVTARDARDVAVACPSVGPMVLHRDVTLLAPLVRDAERARWFVDRELGALAAADPVVLDLRRTALTYLETGGSLVTTAQRLHVHRNTVVYRMKRVGELLGRPLTERTLETHAALRLAVALG